MGMQWVGSAVYLLKQAYVCLAVRRPYSGKRAAEVSIMQCRAGSVSELREVALLMRRRGRARHIAWPFRNGFAGEAHGC